MFIIVPFASTQQTHVNASSDWTPPINLSVASDLIADSPVLLCDQAQNLHLVWFERSADTSFVYYRTDANEQWNDAYDILIQPLMTYLDAAITPDGLLHLVWVSARDPALYYAQAPLAHAYSTLQWSEPQILATDLAYGMNVYGGSETIVADDEGILHIVYAEKQNHERLVHELYYIRSEDSGATWSLPAYITSVNSPITADVFPSLALDGNGNLHVTWTVRSDDYGVYSALGYMRSTDAGNTWGEYREIAEKFRSSEDRSPGVAMLGVFTFGDNQVHLTWSMPTRLHQWSLDGGVSWSDPVVIMELSAAFGGFNKLDVDSNGQLHVVSAVGNGVFHSAQNGSDWGVPQVIDDRNFDPHGQQLVVCQGNQLHIVYHDRTDARGIWYATNVINAPIISRNPVPFFKNDEPTTIREDLSPEADAYESSGDQDALPLPQSLALAKEEPVTPSSTFSLFISAMISLLFIIGVVILNQRRIQR